MAKITVSVEDIKSTLSFEAGWKKGKLVAVTSEPSAKKDSMNQFFEFEFEVEPGDVRKAKYCINDKNKKMKVMGLIKVYEGLYDVVVDGSAPFDFDPEASLGLETWLEFDKTIFNGRPQNQIQNFSAKQPF